MRKSVGGFCIFISVVSVIFVLAFNSNSLDDTEWTMHGINTNLTSWDGVDFSRINGLNFAEFYVGSNSDFYTSPTVVNGFVYIGNENNYIYQLNASNISQQIANFETGGLINEAITVVNSYAYIGSNDNTFYQLNASNISQQIANYTMGGPSTTSAVVVNGSVYVSCATSGELYQLNASNVSQMITNTTTSPDVGSYFSTGVAVANGFLYVGNNWGHVYQLNVSNISQQIAFFEGPGSSVISSPTVYGGLVYIGIYHSLYQLNASNISQQLNSYEFGDSIASPLVLDNYVYVGSRDDIFYQLNTSNISQQIANYSTGYDIFSAPSIDQGSVYIGSDDNTFYQLNASNISQQIANYTTTGDAQSVAVANGYVYGGSSVGILYQLNAIDISLTKDSSVIPLFNCKTSGWVENGTYQLMDNISSSSTCFGIDANNVTLDGNGYWLEGTGSDGSYGVEIRSYNDSNIKNLKISNFSDGLLLEHAEVISIENVLSINSEDGFYSYDCPNLILRDNNFSGNDINIEMEIEIASSTEVLWDVDSSNILDYDKILYYNKSLSNYEFNSVTSPNAGMIICVSCFNVNVSGLDLEAKTSAGIFFMNTTNSTIQNNLISYYNIGIYIEESGNNLIQFNNLSNTIGGIYSLENLKGNNYTFNKFSDSLVDVFSKNDLVNELFYGNYFDASFVFFAGNVSFNNSLGGNYWINSTDGFSETCADSDSDGVCDNSYTVSAGSVDYMPLSEWPTTVFDPIVEEEEEEDDSSGSSPGSSTPMINMGKIDDVSFIGELKYGYRGSFEFKNESHRIYLKEVNRKTSFAKFDVYSDKQSIEVKVGKEKGIDLDSDGIMDVLLRLNSISETNTAVNLELGDIVIEDIRVVDEGEVDIDEDENKNKNIESVSYMSYIIGLIVVILVIVILFLFSKKDLKKKKE